MKARLDIQILRAIAVISVVVYHFAPRVVVSGFIGVDIFFVISGFLITRLLVRDLQDKGRISLRGFYARRIRRIFPASLVVLALTTALVWISGSPDQIAIHARHVFASAFSFENILLAGDSVDYLHQTDTPSALQHFWSLAVEEQFYFVWPPLIVLLGLIARRLKPVKLTESTGSRSKTNQRTIKSRTKKQSLSLIPERVAISAIVIASFGFASIMLAADNPAIYFNSFGRAWELGLGALIAVYGEALNRFDASENKKWFRLAAWIVVIVSPLVPGIDAAIPGWTLLAPLAATAILLGTSAAVAEQKNWLLALGTKTVTGALHWVGDRSFSIYLWHWPALITVPLILHLEMNPGLALVTLLGVVLVSDLSYRFIENPFRFGKQRWLRSTTVLTGGALVLSGLVSAAAFYWQPLAGKPAPGIDAFPGGSGSPTQPDGESVPPRETLRGIDVTGIEPFCIGAGAALFDCEPGYAAEYALDALPIDPPVNKNCEWTDRNIIIDCVLGDVTADRAAIYVGDSHAKSLWPAIDSVGKRAGIAVHTYFTSSCEFKNGGVKNCVNQNEQVSAEIATGEYEFVLTRQSVDFQNEVPGDQVYAFMAMWQPVIDAGIPLVIIADNPRLTDEKMNCIILHNDDGTRCAFKRTEGYRYNDDAITTASKLKLPVINFANILCGKRVCQPIIGGMRVYRDLGHLSTVFSETLSPFLYAALDGFGLLASPTK